MPAPINIRLYFGQKKAPARRTQVTPRWGHNPERQAEVPGELRLRKVIFNLREGAADAVSDSLHAGDQSNSDKCSN